MVELYCDFNSGGKLAAIRDFPDLREHVEIGDRVLLSDEEGNSCEGTIEIINPGWNDNYATCRVQLDMETWKSEGG